MMNRFRFEGSAAAKLYAAMLGDSDGSQRPLVELTELHLSFPSLLKACTATPCGG